MASNDMIINLNINKDMTDVRCPKCNHMLFRVWRPFEISTVQIETRCSSCKEVSTWPSYEKAETSIPIT